VELTTILILFTRDAPQEMLQEAVLKDKIPTQFSRRTRAAQARSSDSINQIQLQEVHSDITRQA
jgi:hypothetical protein